jgi:hypothetical protein
MAIKKITQLTSLAQADVAATADVLPIVDLGASETKKVTPAALVGGALPNITVTWNDVLTNFDAFKIDVTDTASGASSNLIDLQVGSVSKFRVTKSGTANIAGALTVSSVTTLTGAVTASSSVTSINATAGVGYGTGAGGTVTQATSKATGVTLNKICGTITMDAATLAHQTPVAFTLTNSAIAATDVVAVCVKSGGTAGAYLVSAGAVAAGSCSITLFNCQTSGSLSEAVVLSFAVIKAVAA